MPGVIHLNVSHPLNDDVSALPMSPLPEASPAVKPSAHTGHLHADEGKKPAKADASLPYLRHPSRGSLNVFVMRHASAGTSRVNPKLDVKRPLDKDGKRHCLQLAQVLSNLRISFDLIVSSPLKRCLQTAQLIGTEMGYEARILHAQALEPGADFAQFQRLLHECRTYENVLMVGHNPNMTAFLGQLVVGNADRENTLGMANVRLRKGAIARVTLERGPAVLKWLLDPRLVRSLYATSTKSSRRKTSRK